MTEVVDPDVSQARETRPFPFDRTGQCPLDPPPRYAELRDNEPVSRVKLTFNGRESWLLTRYEDVRAVLSDPRFSSDMALPNYPLQFEFPMELLGKIRPTLIHMDPPDHTVHRMVLMPELTVKKVEAMRPGTQAIVDRCIDEILEQGPPVNLVRTLAFQVPSLATCELLDLPVEYRPMFHRWVGTVVNQSSAEEHATAATEVEITLHKLIAERDAAPGDDLISGLLRRNKRDNTQLDHQDISALLRALLAGGHETTVSAISASVLALLLNPEQADILRADPSLAGQAVDELLRYISISDHGTVRVATEDVEVNGITIRAGEGVITSLSAANHDPAIFADPNALDVHRKESRHNVAFGYGRHMCAGQTLSRMQMEVVLTTLLRRIPTLRIDGGIEAVEFKKNALVRGLLNLPVTW